jgi:tetratricopeptide (TPR) repeat protein
MKHVILSIFLLVGSSLYAVAQEDKTQVLARQYFQNGDYQKAAELYEQLLKKDPANFFFYNSLFNSYLRLNDYKSAEDLVKKQQKRNKSDLRFMVDLGYVYSQDNQAKKAEQTFDEAIAALSANENEVRTLAGKFMSYRQDDYVIKTYLKGNQLFNDDSKFAFDLGNAYIRVNKAPEAVEYWLIVLDRNPHMMQSVQSMIANNIQVKGLQDALETKLYTFIQKQPSRNDFAEMLIWLFTHQKDYEGALVQARALDKRNNEDGWRIMNLANNAMREEAYDAAINAYTYLLTKGEQSNYYRAAQSEILRARKQKLLSGNYSQQDIAALQSAYENFLEKYGKTPQNAQTIRDLANLNARYLFNLDRAIELLEALIVFPQLQKRIRNEAKLDLGDYYLQKGDIWEATLIYSQVDKDEKDSPLGEDARFRNARLSYFKGEFEWAQAQLNILKGATSELIANDALKLSVFIMDNLGLDTSTAAMKIYADAELLYMQNRNTEALAKLDVILKMFPGHALTDDVLMKKARIYLVQRDYDLAVKNLDLIVLNHAEDILADDAIFMLGEIYQKHLNDIEKAMELYKRIITDYTDSVLQEEARKRFRMLRGDGV